MNFASSWRRTVSQVKRTAPIRKRRLTRARDFSSSVEITLVRAKRQSREPSSSTTFLSLTAGTPSKQVSTSISIGSSTSSLDSSQDNILSTPLRVLLLVAMRHSRKTFLPGMPKIFRALEQREPPRIQIVQILRFSFRMTFAPLQS